METVIKLPDVEAVQNFVKVATETDCDVLVSKEGYKYIIDGTSILGMLNVVGARIIVKCLLFKKQKICLNSIMFSRFFTYFLFFK